MPLDYTVYADTNCFVQLRDLGQVVWRELLPDAKRVEIVVAPIVVTELDRFKVDRDRRKRDRSRRALALIEAATANDDFTTVLADGPVRVTLRLCVGGRMPWDDYPDLDPGSPDDQLVLCAVCETAGGEQLLMSFDNNPLIRARVAKLAARISPFAWQLPEQEDEAGQEVAKLKRELAEARSTRPKIEAAFMRDGQPTSLFDVRVLTASPIPDRLLDYLVETWLEANPKTPPVFEVRPSHTLFDPFAGRITQDEIQAYERDYDAFVRDVRKGLAARCGKACAASNCVIISSKASAGPDRVASAIA